MTGRIKDLPPRSALANINLVGVSAARKIHGPRKTSRSLLKQHPCPDKPTARRLRTHLGTLGASPTAKTQSSRQVHAVALLACH